MKTTVKYGAGACNFNKSLESKLMSMEMDFLRRLAKNSWLERKLEIMLLERNINIKNSFLNYVRYKQFNWYGHVQRMNEERLPQKKFGMVSTWKKEERKTSKFVDAESNNWN